MSPARAKDTSKKTGSLLFGREPVFYAPMIVLRWVILRAVSGLLPSGARKDAPCGWAGVGMPYAPGVGYTSRV